MVLSIMTKAVLAKTDRQLAVTHNFSSVGFGRPTAMLAETDGPFVMTNAMLAKIDRQAERCQSFFITCVAIP